MKPGGEFLHKEPASDSVKGVGAPSAGKKHFNLLQFCLQAFWTTQTYEFGLQSQVYKFLDPLSSSIQV